MISGLVCGSAGVGEKLLMGRGHGNLKGFLRKMRLTGILEVAGECVKTGAKAGFRRLQRL
jgi:hypothetical protein